MISSADRESIYTRDQTRAQKEDPSRIPDAGKRLRISFLFKGKNWGRLRYFPDTYSLSLPSGPTPDGAPRVGEVGGERSISMV